MGSWGNRRKKTYNEEIRAKLRRAPDNGDPAGTLRNCMKEAATEQLTQQPRKPGDAPESQLTKNLKKLIENASNKGGNERITMLTKHLNKSRKGDRRANTLKQMECANLKKGEWSTLRMMKNEYQPRPYCRTNEQGEHIPMKDIPEKSAEHLAQTQWGDNKEDNWKEIPNTKLARESPDWNLGDIELFELKAAIRKAKRNKAPGPDNIETELFKELDDENLTEVLGIMNNWWNNR